MISRESIQLVRERADIVAVVGERVKLKRTGRSYVGLCPFHQEKTPSFHVNPESGRFYCFGCHEKGSVIDFLMKFEGLTFVEAVQSLAEQFGVELRYVDGGRPDAQAADAKRKQGLYELMNLAATFFERQLREHPLGTLALEELARRDLSSSKPTGAVTDTLQAFRIGYAPAQWDALVGFLQKRGISPALAESVGLVVARKQGGGYYDFFRHRLMFPIIDPQGRVIAFSGRVLPDPDSGEVPKRVGKYVNSPESGIYKKSDVLFGLYQARRAIREKGAAILVEGNFDVVSLHARGVEHVVAPLGTAFTEHQARLLARFARKVVLIFDGDAAGAKAVRASREPCQKAGLAAYVGSVPEGSDPDEFVREYGKDALDRVVGEAKDMLSWLIEDILNEDFSRADMQKQAEKVRQVAALLGSERDPTVRALARRFADEVAARLGISDVTTFRALQRQIDRAVHAGGNRSGQPPERSNFRADYERLPLEMLGCAIDFPEILSDPDVIEASNMLEGDTLLALDLLRRLDPSEKHNWEQTFLAHLPDAIHEFAASRLAAPRVMNVEEARALFLSNAQKWKRLVLSREHAQVIEDIQSAGATGNTEQEDDLLLEAVKNKRKRLGI